MSPAPTGEAGGAYSLARAGGAPEAKVDDEALMLHINTVFLVLLAVYTLVRLPQAFSLFSSKEWLGAHFLRRVAARPVVRHFAAQDAYSPAPVFKERGCESSDDSHDGYNHPSLRLTEKGTPAVMNFPAHIPVTWFQALHPLLTPLRARIMPGFSFAQTFVVVMYFYAMVYATFFQSNVFTDSTRTGWVAITQLPLVFAFAQKNNVIGGLLGYGYEKLNYLHRFGGRIVVLVANIHAFHYVYKWTLDGVFTAQIQQPNYMWGLVAVCCFDVIFLFSTAFWRQKAYNLFLSSHIIGFSLVLPAIYLHQDSTLPYILTALGLFGFDHLLRLIKTRFLTASLRAIPELDMTRVEIHGVNAGWRAGQHVRLRVLSSGMGLVGWAEVHPFTIASVARSEDGMVLMCKRAGGWTRRLYEMAKAGGNSDGGVGREVKIMVDGPYGGPQRIVFSSFSAAVFIVGGSGITFALTAIQDLVQKDLAGESRVKAIELVWIVKDSACLTPLLPTLIALTRSSVFTAVRISVFYTRAPTGQQPAFFESTTDVPFVNSSSHQSLKPQPQHFPPGLTLSPGRPRVIRFIEFALQRVIALRSASQHDIKLTGLVVGVCGPIGLADATASAVASVEASLRDQVGGIEVCEEVFGW